MPSEEKKMTFEAFKSEFEYRASSSRLWSHPWFIALKRQPQIIHLVNWAIAAGAIDEVFVELLRALRANPSIHMSAHGALERNIADEEGGGNPSKEHFTLFRAVLGVLGVSDKVYRDNQALPLPGTEALVLALKNAVAGPDSVRALAMMANEELICPWEFPRLMEALRLVAPNRAEEWEPYFKVHCECDPEHSSDLIVALYKACGGQKHNYERAFACQAEDLALNAAFYDSLALQCALLA